MDDSSLITSKASCRVGWVDSARVLAMFFVMYSHVVSYGLHFKQFHMAGGSVAVFFLLAGYFSRYKSFDHYLKRLMSLVAFYVFYCYITLFVFELDYIEGWESFLWYLKTPKGTVMWFMYDLIFASLFIPVLGKMPVWLKGIMAIILLVYGMNQFRPFNTLHISVNFYFAMGLFVAGNSFAHKSLDGISRTMTGHRFGVPTWIPFVLGWFILSTVCAISITNWVGVPAGLGVWLVVWGMFAVAHGMERFWPRIHSLLAVAGPSVIFMYGAHFIVFRVYHGVAFHYFDNANCPLLDYALILVTMRMCYLIYRRLVGRNKVLDACLFAR